MKNILLILILFPFIVDAQTQAVSIGYSDTAHFLRISNEQVNFPTPQSGTLLHLVSSGITINPRISMDTYNGANVLGSVFQGRRAGGTADAPENCTTDMTLVALTGDGFGTSSFTGGGIGSMSIKAEGSFTNTSKPTYINFLTSPSGSTSATERMRIKSNGTINISGLNSAGFVQTNSSGDLSTSSLTSGQVTTALTYTPIKPADTASMLTPYLRYGDTTNMLLPYLRKTGTLPIGNITGLGAGVSTFLATPTSANLAAAVPDESGNGSLLFANGNIGAATGTSLTATGFIGSTGTAGIGYGTGAGGTVTQSTSKTTGVTLNKRCGTITMNASSIAAGSSASFVLTNSIISATDVVMVCIKSGATLGSYALTVGAVSAGSCTISLSNLNTLSSLSEAVVINFVVIESVSN